MNIGDMRAYIRSIVEIDSSDISDDVLNRFLGEGYDQVVYSEKRWPWYEVSTTFDTVSSTSDYTLATVGASVTNGLREVQAIRTDDHVLTFLGRDDGDIVYPLNSASTGDFYYWSFWANNVRLYPTPSSAQTLYVRGYKSPSAFGAGSLDSVSPSDFPEPFHVVIATYGVAAVGINIPRIFNLVLIEPGKSFVRVIQSIGRGIRKAEAKDSVSIWDITRACKFARRHLTQR